MGGCEPWFVYSLFEKVQDAKNLLLALLFLSFLPEASL